jgi:flagellin-specific chaperone FliS
MDDERKFLHEVANPVATALFVADALLEELRSSQVAIETVEQLARVTQALEKTQKIIQGRRTVLQGLPSHPGRSE